MACLLFLLAAGVLVAAAASASLAIFPVVLGADCLAAGAAVLLLLRWSGSAWLTAALALFVGLGVVETQTGASPLLTSVGVLLALFGWDTGLTGTSIAPFTGAQRRRVARRHGVKIAGLGVLSAGLAAVALGIRLRLSFSLTLALALALLTGLGTGLALLFGRRPPRVSRRGGARWLVWMGLRKEKTDGHRPSVPLHR